MKTDHTTEDSRAETRKHGVPGEMQIETLRRVPVPPAPRNPVPRGHAPRITQDRTRITGCTCGWRTPPGTADSDDAYVAHAAVMR